MSTAVDELRQVELFVRLVGRWPSELSEDPHECGLGQRLNQACHWYRTGQMSMRERFQLSVLLPGWNRVGEDLWLQRARALSDAILTGDPFAVHQTHLAGWRHEQLSLERHGLLNTNRARWLDEHAPHWRTQTGTHSR